MTDKILASTPPDIWDVILRKIELPYLKVLSTVSRFFRTLTERHVWEDLRLKITEKWRQQRGSEIFKGVTDKLKHVHSLTIFCESYVIHDEFVFERMFTDISKNCVNMQELDLEEYRGQVTITFLNDLYKNCPNLRSLKFGTAVPKQISETNTKGKIGGKTIDMLQGFDKLFKASTTSLQSLNMAISLSDKQVEPQQYVEFLRKVLAKSPNLKSLALSNVANQKAGFSTQLLRNVVLPLFDTHTSLRVFQLKGCWGSYNLHKDEVEMLFSKFGTLEELEFSELKPLKVEEGSGAETDASSVLDLISSHCTAIQALKWSFECRKLKEDKFSLFTLANLKRFQISCLCYTVPDIPKLINNLAASCTKLEEIKIVSARSPGNLSQIQFGPALKKFSCENLAEPVSVTPFLQTSKTLRELNLGVMTIGDLKLLVDSCSLLTSLSVLVGDIVDIGYIMEKLPNLESLTINGTFTDTSFTTPAVCLNLKKLVLKNKQPHMSDLPMFYLSEACPNLEYLSYPFGVSYDLKFLLESRLQKLRTIVNTEKTPVMANILSLVNQKRAVKIEKASS